YLDYTDDWSGNGFAQRRASILRSTSPRSKVTITGLINKTYDYQWGDFDLSAYGKVEDYSSDYARKCMLFNTSTGSCLNTQQKQIDELYKRLETTCTKMRAKGIHIYFILFALASHPDKANAVAHFQSCVGTGGKFYDAVTGTDLTDAFSDIAVR